MTTSTSDLKQAKSYLIEQDYGRYTPEQHSLWSDLVSRQMAQLEDHAAQEYLDGYAFIGLQRDSLPDLKEISSRLNPRTGWNATAVSGFMPGPAFFEMLAARKFPTTTWLRDRESLDYTPQPDIFHDVFGHVPMHAHPVFADFLQRCGQLCASLSDEDMLERMGRLFWYTVEFGLIRQNGQIKVYGSGLISSNGECTNVIAGGCAIHDFTLDEVLRTPVKIDEMHRLLFAIDSFDQLYDALKVAEDRIAAGTLQGRESI